MDALNQKLYDALTRVFRHVEITSQGDPGQISYWPNWDRDGRKEAQVTGGEYYKVSCPFCSDTRKRLWFNYRWGLRDPETGSDMLFLVNCYNESCVDNRAVQEQLRDMLGTDSWGNLPTRPRFNTRIEKPPKIELPKCLVPITDAEQASDARWDLEDRNFDLQDLWERWRVFYCASSDSPPPKLRQRIVIPVYGLRRKLAKGEKFGIALEGWQARAIEPISEGEPKYLTAKGMRKSQLLYGATSAVESQGPVVICEGPTDVWRLRTNGVALFGKDLSYYQRNLIVHRFEGRPVVVLLDRDAKDEAQAIVRQIRSERRVLGDKAPVVVASPPSHREDVGDCTWLEAWLRIANSLGTTVAALPLQRNLKRPVRHPEETASWHPSLSHEG
jgi:hypothetical protein